MISGKVLLHFIRQGILCRPVGSAALGWAFIRVRAATGKVFQHNIRELNLCEIALALFSFSPRLLQVLLTLFRATRPARRARQT